MATYLELHGLRGTLGADQLMQKIAVGVCIKANALAKATPTTIQKDWAKSALTNPDAYVGIILNYILAEYNTASVTTILGASEAQIQGAVDAAVNTLLGA